MIKDPGLSHETGSGNKPDKVESAEWYRKAAGHGLDEAEEARKKLDNRL